jgi:hypothetical protein
MKTGELDESIPMDRQQGKAVPKLLASTFFADLVVGIGKRAEIWHPNSRTPK